MSIIESTPTERMETKPDGRPARDVLLTESDLASYLALSKFTLRNWRVQGKGPVFLRLSGRMIRYRMSDVIAWSDALAASSTSDW